MRTPTFLTRSARLTAAVALLSAASFAQAAEELTVRTELEPFDELDWNETAMVSGFDPELGTLQEVRVAVVGNFNGGIWYENLDAAPGQLTLSSAGELQVAIPGSMPVILDYDHATSVSTEAFDGVQDLDGASGGVHYFDSYFGQSFSFSDPQILAAFTSPMAAEIGLACSTSTLPLSMSGNAASDEELYIELELSVTYVFAPSILLAHQTYEVVFNVQQALWIEDLGIPAFNPAGGTLVAVQVEVETQGNHGMSYESMAPVPLDGSLQLCSRLDLVGPGAVPKRTEGCSPWIPVSLGAFDGTPDLVGPSATTLADVPASGARTQGLMRSDARLDEYYGLGQLAIDVEGRGDFNTSGFQGGTVALVLATGGRVRITYRYRSAQPYSICAGNGGDGMGCTDCPCGNNGTWPIAGCANSLGYGAFLFSSGSTSVSAQDLTMHGEVMPTLSAAVLVSGSNAAPANPGNPCYGTGSGITAFSSDGLRCVVGDILRHGVRVADENGFVHENGWGMNGPIFNSSAFVAGNTRFFQIYYRDGENGPCGRFQNTTQALVVQFTP